MRRKEDFDKIKNWVVYKLINPTGRIYVGQSDNFTKRLGDYGRLSCKNQKILFNSLSKYSLENHTIEILEEFVGNQVEANLREIYWIDFYKCNYSKYKEYNGMNLTDGGYGTSGYRFTEEDKEKMSKSHIGIKHSVEWVRKSADARKGMKMSDEARANMSKAGRGNPKINLRGEKNGMSKLTEKIILEIINRYNNGENIKELSIAFNISNSHLSCIISGTKWSQFFHLINKRSRSLKLTLEVVNEIKEKSKYNKRGIILKEYNISRSTYDRIINNKHLNKKLTV